MKIRIVLLATLLLSLTSGFATTPERWVCVNARDASGLFSLEVTAVTSAGGQPWRSLDVYLVKDAKQDFDTVEAYGYPPALTSVRERSERVIIEGQNRKVFGKTVASLTIDLRRAKSASFSSYFLSVAGFPIRGKTAVYEGTLMLDTGSSADANEIPMNCAEMPAGN